jgi:hypothetical protein
MTLHFHGVPITPTSVLESLAGRCFCVSFAYKGQVERCHEIGQAVMLDNGAFTFWKQRTVTDFTWWKSYYHWAERWLACPTTWAVIPDVIEGGAEANDKLIQQWPFGVRGAPVWHMDEPLERLSWLTSNWPKVCIGSSGRYAQLRTHHWHQRMEKAFNTVWEEGPAPPQIHLLRGMAQVGGPYPFASVDSTDVARNHNRPQNTALEMASRWDASQCPHSWRPRLQLDLMPDSAS